MRKIILTIALAGLLISCENAATTSGKTDKANIQTASVFSFSKKSSVAGKNQQNEMWLESLITDTPQEGRELAITMARKTIGAIQSDPEVKKRLRKEYAEDSEQLILSAQVVAIEFQTVAAANNYWRK